MRGHHRNQPPQHGIPRSDAEEATYELPAGRDDIRQVLFVQESSRPQLAELARLIDEGHLRPQVGAVYPLARGAEAFSAKAAGGMPGRIVLEP